MNFPGCCYRCEEPGHGWRDCGRPPAKSQQELDQRIDRIVQRWDAGNGAFSRTVKTRIVEIETRQFEKARAK